MPRGTQPTVINYFSKPKWVSSQQYWEGWGEDGRKTWPKSWAYQEATRGDLPWWASGWGSACQFGGHRFDPWPGKIPHATEQLGPWVTATEALMPKPVLSAYLNHNRFMHLPVCTACMAHPGFADWLHSGLVSFLLTRGISEMDLVPAEW